MTPDPKEKYRRLAEIIEEKENIIAALRKNYPIDCDSLRTATSNLAKLKRKAIGISENIDINGLVVKPGYRPKDIQDALTVILKGSIEPLINSIGRSGSGSLEDIIFNRAEIEQNCKYAEKTKKQTKNPAAERCLTEYISDIKKTCALLGTIESVTSHIDEAARVDLATDLTYKLKLAYKSARSYCKEQLVQANNKKKDNSVDKLDRTEDCWLPEKKLVKASRILLASAAIPIAANSLKYLNNPKVESLRETLASLPLLEQLVHISPVPLAWVAAAGLACASVVPYVNYKLIQKKRTELKPAYWLDKCKSVLQKPFSKAKLDEAKKYVDNALKLNSKLAETWNLKGTISDYYIYFADSAGCADTLKEILDCYTEAAKISPTSPDFVNNRESTLMFSDGFHSHENNKLLDGALKCYERAIELNSHNIYARQWKAGLLIKMGRLDAALDEYRALAAEIHYRWISDEIGRVQEAKKLIGEGDALFESLTPKNAAPNGKRILGIKGKPAEDFFVPASDATLRYLAAKKCYEKASKASEQLPCCAELYKKIGDVELALADADNAKKRFEKAAEIYPEKYREKLSELSEAVKTSKNSLRGSAILERIAQEAVGHFVVTATYGEKHLEELVLIDPYDRRRELYLNIDIDSGEVLCRPEKQLIGSRDMPEQPEYSMPAPYRDQQPLKIPFDLFIENLNREEVGFFKTLSERVGLKRERDKPYVEKEIPREPQPIMPILWKAAEENISTKAKSPEKTYTGIALGAGPSCSLLPRSAPYQLTPPSKAASEDDFSSPADLEKAIASEPPSVQESIELLNTKSAEHLPAQKGTLPRRVTYSFPPLARKVQFNKDVFGTFCERGHEIWLHYLNDPEKKYVVTEKGLCAPNGLPVADDSLQKLYQQYQFLKGSVQAPPPGLAPGFAPPPGFGPLGSSAKTT